MQSSWSLFPFFTNSSLSQACGGPNILNLILEYCEPSVKAFVTLWNVENQHMKPLSNTWLLRSYEPKEIRNQIIERFSHYLKFMQAVELNNRFGTELDIIRYEMNTTIEKAIKENEKLKHQAHKECFRACINTWISISTPGPYLPCRSNVDLTALTKLLASHPLDPKHVRDLLDLAVTMEFHIRKTVLWVKTLQGKFQWFFDNSDVACDWNNVTFEDKFVHHDIKDMFDLADLPFNVSPIYFFLVVYSSIQVSDDDDAKEKVRKCVQVWEYFNRWFLIASSTVENDIEPDDDDDDDDIDYGDELEESMSEEETSTT
jgi:hypothetical protein